MSATLLPLGRANPNYPYPSLRQLRAEGAYDRIMSEQLDAAARLRAAIQSAIDAIVRLEFPCGSPVPGYDVEDVLGTLREMLPGSDAAVRARATETAWQNAYEETER